MILAYQFLGVPQHGCADVTNCKLWWWCVVVVVVIVAVVVVVVVFALCDQYSASDVLLDCLTS